MNTTLLGPSPFFLGYYNHRKYEFLELLNEIKECFIHSSFITTTMTKYGKSMIFMNSMTIKKIMMMIDLLLFDNHYNHIYVQWDLNQGFHLTFQNKTLSSLYQLFHFSTIHMNTFITMTTTLSNDFYFIISMNDLSSSTLFIHNISSSSSIPSLSRRESICSSISSLSTYEEEEEDQSNEALYHLIQDTLQYIHSFKIYSNELKTLGTKLDDLSLNSTSFLLE